MVLIKDDVTIKVAEAVLFPFDDGSIPFRSGLQLNLAEAAKFPENPIMHCGETGTPDSKAVRRPCVIRIDGQYRMWYLGMGKEKGSRMLYATSKDGIHWEKPSLGLKSYMGSRDNNLVDLDTGEKRIATAIIIHDSEEADKEKRFKMVYDALPGHTFNVAFSPDGLRWRNSPANPRFKNAFEIGGLTKYKDCYYTVGQGTAFRKRCLETHASYDFENWTEAINLGFRRDTVPPRPLTSGWHSGPQVHLGASLWNRGNVLLGFYGMWDGPNPENNDRRYVIMNLGLLVSNDGLRYTEPIPDFGIIPAWEEKNPGAGYLPEDFSSGVYLGQGQAFANVGEQTYVWYESWREGLVRLATWPLDRLGYFYISREITEGQRPIEGVTPHFISRVFESDSHKTKIFINADGLSANSWISVELLDEKFDKLPDYSNDKCHPVKESGFRQPVNWEGHTALPDQPFRLKVNYEGLRREDSRVYAVYVKG